jgi:hypothetical protein
MVWAASGKINEDGSFNRMDSQIHRIEPSIQSKLFITILTVFIVLVLRHLIFGIVFRKFEAVRVRCRCE